MFHITTIHISFHYQLKKIACVLINTPWQVLGLPIHELMIAWVSTLNHFVSNSILEKKNSFEAKIVLYNDCKYNFNICALVYTSVHLIK